MQLLGLLASVLILSGCGGEDSGDPLVFPDAKTAIQGLESLRFGDSCGRLHEQVRDRLPKSASDKARKPGEDFRIETSYPILGSSNAYFYCDDGTDRLDKVMLRLIAPLRDYQPYERALARLREQWGEPALEQSREQQSPNAQAIRNLGGNPQTYTLHSAVWRHERGVEATLGMEFGWREIELKLHFEQKGQ